MTDFMTKNKEKLEQFAAMSQAAGSRSDYVQGGGGNTSVKLADGLMAIKASGYCLSDIRPDKAYAVLDYEALRRFYYDNEPAQLADVEKLGSACAKENTKLIEGMDALRPSVEAGFHSILKTFVCHTPQRLRKSRRLLDCLLRDRGKGVHRRGLHLGLGSLHRSRRESDLRHPR